MSMTSAEAPQLPSDTDTLLQIPTLPRLLKAWRPAAQPILPPQALKGFRKAKKDIASIELN